tara:strand:+ start:1557 stop:2687 length:1131 start_codon:yes stop_codon:yes gene_type:complete
MSNKIESGHTLATLAEIEETFQYHFATSEPQPIILLGGTGGGKTWFVSYNLRKAYAQSLGLTADDLGFVTEKLAGRDAQEFAGTPLPVKDGSGRHQMEYTKPPLLLKIEQTGKEYGVVFLDEAPQADNSVQKVARDLMDRKSHSLGGWPIPRGWFVCGAGNRTSDRSGANRLLAHLTDTVCIYEIQQSVSGWAVWADENNVHPLMIACALQYEEQETFFADKPPTEYAQYNSFRSLTNASVHLTNYLNVHGQGASIEEPVIKRMIESNIGKKATEILCSYSALRDKVPSGEDIQRDPESCLVPSDTGFQLLASNNAMASASCSESADRAFLYILRMTSADLKINGGKRMQKIMAANDWVTNSPLIKQFNEHYIGAV